MNRDMRSVFTKTSFTASVLTRSTNGDHWSNLWHIVIVVRLLSKDDNGLIGADNHLKHSVNHPEHLQFYLNSVSTNRSFIFLKLYRAV